MKVVRMLTGMLLVAGLMCSGNLCISASKREGEIPYSSVTVTFLIEVLKLAVMLAVIVATDTAPPARFSALEAFYYAVPSFLYTIDNNLNYVILRFMDAATLSVLWNLKIVVTAVLFRFVLKHQLSDLRKVAIVLLIVGVLTSQSNHLRQMKGAMGSSSSSDGSMGKSGAMSDAEKAEEKSAKELAIGVVLVLVGVTLSSCASVFTEWAFKRKSSCPFYWQNLQMYVFGILFNGVGVLLVDGEAVTQQGFFHGYNQWTVAVVAVNCIGGISMGFLLKYLDNIACVYSHSMAMMLTMLFSMLFFSFSPSIEFGCGFTVLILSMYIYHHPLAHVASSLPSPCLSAPSSSSSSSSSTCQTKTARSNDVMDSSERKRLAMRKLQLTDTEEEDDDSASTASTSSGIGSGAPQPRTVLASARQGQKVHYNKIPARDDLESAPPSTRPHARSLT